MATLDVLQVGCKIEICSVEQAQRNKITGEKTPVLESMLDDITPEGNLIIQMPIYKGKLVLLSIGVRYELVFYEKNSLYQTVAQVVDRYKSDNRYVLKMSLTTGITKLQRREYFRLQCILGAELYPITREEMLENSEQQYAALIMRPEIKENVDKAVIVDISGGGIRFICEKQYEENSYYIVRTIIGNESFSQELILAINIVTCRKANASIDRYETRGEFVHITNKTREIIIKYVFDEDRKIRKKV